MSQSNLSINSSQGSITEFSPNTANSSKGWGSYLFTQLQNHRDALPSHSPQTKFGLIVAVNAFFLLVFGSYFNMRERNNNAKSLENAPLNHFRSTLLLGASIAGANIALSKLLRYDLPLSTLCAISASCVAIHLLLKKPVVIEQRVNPARYLPNSADMALIKAAAQERFEEIKAEEEALAQVKAQLEEEQRQLQAIDATQLTPADEARLQEIVEILGEVVQADNEFADLKTKEEASLRTLTEVESEAPHSDAPSAPNTRQAAVVGELKTKFKALPSSPAANKVRSRLKPKDEQPSLQGVPSIPDLSQPVARKPSSSSSAPADPSQPQQDENDVLETTATKNSFIRSFALGAVSIAGRLAFDAATHALTGR